MTPLLYRLQAACNLVSGATPRTDDHRSAPGTRSELLVEREFARRLERELNLRTQQLAKAVEEVLRQKQKWTDERVRRRLCNAGPLEMEYLQDRIDECDDTLAAVEALEPK